MRNVIHVMIILFLCFLILLLWKQCNISLADGRTRIWGEYINLICSCSSVLSWDLFGTGVSYILNKYSQVIPSPTSTYIAVVFSFKENEKFSSLREVINAQQNLPPHTLLYRNSGWEIYYMSFMSKFIIYLQNNQCWFVNAIRNCVYKYVISKCVDK
jgi:hypothetical protein